MNLKDFITQTLISLPKETKIEFDLSVLPSGCDKEIIISCSGNNGLSRIKFTLELK